jgi:hypothetical protein
VRWVWVIAIAALLGAGPAAADDVSVSASVDRTAAQVGNELTLTVTVEGKFRRSVEPELPPMDDFDVYSGGTSQNFSMINGRIQSSISYRYILVPKKEGKFEIGPVKFVVKDREYATKPIQLEVVAASASLPPGNEPPSDTGRSSAGVDEDRSIFIEATVNRDTVYVNQQITWTLGYYSDGRIALLRSPNYTPPEAEGFWVEDLPPQNKYSTNLNDRRYLVNEIKRGYFPTSPGSFEIGPARVDVVIDDMSAGRMDDFFSRNFRSRGFGKSQTLVTKAKKITVLSLPERGKPAGFNGVVAKDLTLSMSADKQVVQVGEPVNLAIVMNGTGNMKTVAPPVLSGMENFKVYESGSHSDVFKKNYVVTGRKKYDYVVVPKVQGRHTIPAVEMPYFDPVRKKYMVARSHEVRLEVQPGAQEEGRKIIYAGTGDDFEVISQDIRFIKPVPSSMATSTGAIANGRVWVAVHVLPLFALVASVVVERRRRLLRSDVGLARASRALRDAEKKLDAARKSFRSGEAQQGLASVSGAVSGYFADKMNTAAAGLTVDVVEDYLKGRRVDDESIGKVRTIFAECDAARFAAGSYPTEQGTEMVARTGKVLRSLEKRYLR